MNRTWNPRRQAGAPASTESNVLVTSCPCRSGPSVVRARIRSAPDLAQRGYRRAAGRPLTDGGTEPRGKQSP
jgi:hypothetical protein